MELFPLFIVLQNLGGITEGLVPLSQWGKLWLFMVSISWKLNSGRFMFVRINYLQSKCKMLNWALLASFQPLNWSSSLFLLLTVIHLLSPSIIFSANNMFINQMDNLNLSVMFMSYIHPGPENLVFEALNISSFHSAFRNLHSFIKCWK